MYSVFPIASNGKALESKIAISLGELSTFLSFEWNLIRLGGPAHEIVTNTVHKTLPGGGGVVRVWGRWLGVKGWWGMGWGQVGCGGVQRVVGVWGGGGMGVMGVWGWVGMWWSRCDGVKGWLGWDPGVVGYREWWVWGRIQGVLEV